MRRLHGSKLRRRVSGRTRGRRSHTGYGPAARVAGAGVQALYGAPAPGRTPIRGRLSGSGNSQVHPVVIERPARLTVSLRGPVGVDFDLYLRAGSPPTRRVFDARGFSALPNEEVALDVTGGTVFILVDSWRGSGDYELRIQVA